MCVLSNPSGSGGASWHILETGCRFIIIPFMTTENWVLFLHRLLKIIPSGLSAEAYWTLIPTMLVCTHVFLA